MFKRGFGVSPTGIRFCGGGGNSPSSNLLTSPSEDFAYYFVLEFPRHPRSRAEIGKVLFAGGQKPQTRERTGMWNAGLQELEQGVRLSIETSCHWGRLCESEEEYEGRRGRSRVECRSVYVQRISSFFLFDREEKNRVLLCIIVESDACSLVPTFSPLIHS